MKKGRYIIAITLLVIYLIIMFVFFIYPNLKDKGNETYLIANKDAKWFYEDGEWEDIENIKEYDWEKYDIYQNNEFIGNYSLVYNDNWYIFEDDRTPVNQDSVDIFAIRTNQKYKFGAFNLSDVSGSDLNYVREVLANNDIESENFTVNQTINYDLDGDNEEEKLFVVSNLFTKEASKYVYNFIFMVNDNKISMIKEDIDSYANMYDNCQAYIAYLVDITGNGTYEIITGCAYYSDRGNCMEMYELSSNKYKQVKACQEF